MKKEDEVVVKVLEQRKQAMLDDIQALERVILSFTNPASNTHASVSDKIDHSDNGENDRQKVANIIKEANRFVKVREIAIMLNGKEPYIPVEDWLKKISPVLSFLKSRGTVAKYVVGKSNQNTFWGSPNWLDENKRIKPGHMYNESQVLKKESYVI